jgi:hypothetical protein
MKSHATPADVMRVCVGVVRLHGNYHILGVYGPPRVVVRTNKISENERSSPWQVEGST